MTLSRLLAVLLLAIALNACRDGGQSLTRIEPLQKAERIAGTAAALSAHGPALSVALPQAEPQPLASDAAVLAAVRSGVAVAGLVRRGPAAPGDGLSITDFDVQPVAAFVSFTLPLEELTSRQLRDLAAGRIRNWRDLGGPALPVEVLLRDGESVQHALDGARGTAVEDIAAALAERRGRVVLAPGESGGALVKALRVDGMLPGDPGYPFMVRWAVAAAARDERGAALARALAGHIAAEREPEVVLDAVGDIMLGRTVGATIAARGPRYPFEAVAPLLAGADIRLGNLELPLTERGQQAQKDYTFRAPPSVVAGLTSAGFNVLTLANNHVLDYGAEGLLDTLAALDRAGIAHPGAGRNRAEAHAPAVLTVRGVRLAILAYVNTPDDGVSGWVAESTRAGPSTPGVAWGTADTVRREVAAARGKADLVIVALHAGWEYTGPPSPVQRELAYAAIDAGAALVLGAHPHVLQGIELYKQAPIVYSLGNFIFDVDEEDRRQPGLPSVLTAVLRIRLGREGVRGMELRPAVIDPRDGRPVPVSGAAAWPVYERVYSLTDALSASTR